MTLGQRIQEMRKQNGLSQEALGEKLGVSRQAVSRWEMDGAVPEVDKLIAMSKLFGVSLNDLLRVADHGAAAQETVEEETSETVQTIPEGMASDNASETIPEGMASDNASAKGRPLTVLLSLVCVAAVVTSALSLAGAIQLRARTTALESRLTQISQGMDSASLQVASVDYGFTFLPNNQRMVDCTFILTAAQMVEDMTVTLQLVDTEGKVQLVEMERYSQNGSVYAANFAVDAYLSPITCTALFGTPSGIYTKALLRWNDIDPATCSWRWDSLDENLVISTS